MSKITGRPKKAVRQEKFLGFFVTHQQHFVINQKAARAGVNISDYLRQTAITGTVMTRWTAEERESLKKLVGMANDINQLVELARKDGKMNAVFYFEQYRGRIDWVIKQFGYDK